MLLPVVPRRLRPPPELLHAVHRERPPDQLHCVQERPYEVHPRLQFQARQSLREVEWGAPRDLHLAHELQVPREPHHPLEEEAHEHVRVH